MRTESQNHKLILAIFVGLALLAYIVLSALAEPVRAAETNTLNGTFMMLEYYPTTNAVPSVSDATIRELAESGEVCRVIGHVWVPATHLTLEYDPSAVGYRICGICGKKQVQRVGPWE